MDFDHTGKVALVTGGAGGIGREIVRQYALAGAAVAIIDIDEKAGHGLETELVTNGYEAVFLHADISRPAACEVAVAQAVSRFGKIDALVNCAGLGRGAHPRELAVDDWDYVLNVNLRAAFLFARLCSAHMKTAGGGAIVNIASTRAIMSEPNTEAYAASKGGLLALTHALAASLAPDYIRVNCVSPGWICTEGTEALTDADHAQHFSGRVGTPLDIARACLYLTMDGNEFINGQNIVIDGGMTKKMIYV